MKKMKLITVAALSLAALASVSTAVSAAPVGSQDLILGFEVQDSAGQGGTIDLEFDLGAAISFTSATSLTFSQVTAAALSSTYGSNWATRGDLVYGVGGVLSDGNIASNFDLTSQVAVKTASNNTLAGSFGQVGGLASGLNNNGNSAVPTSSSQSFKAERTVTTADFGLGSSGQFSIAGQSETVNGSGPVGSIDLYQFQPNSARNAPLATDLGTFNLTSAGVFTFTGSAAAVPEPSAYALGICAAVLFVVLRRRNKIA